jgi:hypothetical protein
MMSDNLPLLVLLFVLFVVIVVPFARQWWWNEAKEVPIQFAKVIVEHAGSSAGVGVAGLMLLIFSFVSAGEFFSATTVLQQIAALLLWIGSSTFFGIFIIAGTIVRKQTYIVYSELALNMERNIARLENLQEQASSVGAVANAVRPSIQVSAVHPPQAIKQEPI